VRSGYRLRKCEIVLVAYFFYLAALAPWFHDRPRADIRVLGIAGIVTSVIVALAWFDSRSRHAGFSIARDWVSLGLVLAAYRSLDLFSPENYTFALERSWVVWDHLVLDHWGLRKAIESSGPALPVYFEFCYLLTSGAGVYGLAVLYLRRKRNLAGEFLFIYILGTLLAYAIIPWFPSEPPRVVFPLLDSPHVLTAIRRYNLDVLSHAGIHAGVFPSAHVSSTFSAAWGLFAVLPKQKLFGWLFLIYAASVAVATVYGRYHFAVDAVAGIAVSIVAAGIAAYLRNFPKQKR
jgi:membrane-associated phospholipid phosphatase